MSSTVSDQVPEVAPVAVHKTPTLAGLELLEGTSFMEEVGVHSLYLDEDVSAGPVAHRALVRGGEIISVVGPRYEVYQNTDFLSGIVNVLEATGTNAVIKDVICKGPNSGLLLDFPDYKITDDSQGGTYQLLARNSFDSGTSVHFQSGLFRFVCLNMMVIGKTDIYESIRHSAALPFRMEAVLDAMQRTLRQGPTRIQESINQLGQTIESIDEYRDLITGTLEDAKVPKKVLTYTDSIEEYALTGTRKENLTAYGALCVVSDAITHGTQSNIVAKYGYLRSAKNSLYERLSAL